MIQIFFFITSKIVVILNFHKIERKEELDGKQEIEKIPKFETLFSILFLFYISNNFCIF
jgi:hypothetical protein